MVLVGAAAGFVVLMILVLGFGIRVVSLANASAPPLELTSDVVSFVLGSGVEREDRSANDLLLDAYERSVIIACSARLGIEGMASAAAAAESDANSRRQANRDAIRAALMQGRH